MTTIDLDNLHLEHGSHPSRTAGVCVMEAVAWYAGENHSDMPACVSPFLRRFGIRLNDALPEWLPKWLRLANLEDLAVKAERSAELTGSELRDALYAIRNLTRQARADHRQRLRARVEAELRERWAKEGKPVAVAGGLTGSPGFLCAGWSQEMRRQERVCDKAENGIPADVT